MDEVLLTISSATRHICADTFLASLYSISRLRGRRRGYRDDVIVLCRFVTRLIGGRGGGALTPADGGRWGREPIKAGGSPCLGASRHTPTHSCGDSTETVIEGNTLLLSTHGRTVGEVLWSVSNFFFLSVSPFRCRGALVLFACRSSSGQLCLRPSGWPLR